MLESAATALLLGLVSHRLWRLLARDEITSALRPADDTLVGQWLLCPWCSGTWIAAAVVGGLWLTVADVPAWEAVVVWLAASTVVGLAGDR